MPPPYTGSPLGAPPIRYRRFDAEEQIGGEEVRPLDAEDGVAEIAQLVLATSLELECRFRVGAVDVVLARSVELGDDLVRLIGEVSARNEVPSFVEDGDLRFES